MKLVMTLLVRDEADILEQNICFHLNNGVDFIVATNNNSIDGTKDILEKYRKMGYLYYIDEPGRNLEQDKWVSRMAAMAIDEYQADYLIHCDADEFWMPNKGNLKDCLLAKKDLMLVGVINYLPSIDGKYLDSKYIVGRPLECPQDYEEKDPSKFLLYSYHPKIITSLKYRNIAKGNHMVISDKKVKKVWNNNIFIHHFSVRSYEQFERKVIEGGIAVANRHDTDLNISWQRRKWYEIYKNGNLVETFNKLSLNNIQDFYLKNGNIKFSKVPRSIRYAREIFYLNKLFSFK